MKRTLIQLSPMMSLVSLVRSGGERGAMVVRGQMVGMATTVEAVVEVSVQEEVGMEVGTRMI